MCCFSGPVKSVTDTNLFARMTGKGTQMLAYQMKFESLEENAMILPLPVATPARENSLRFISLKAYDNFFQDLDRAFPVIHPPQGLRTDSLVESVPESLAVIEVQEVGDFVASFVPTMDDFSRLDPRFVIPKSSWDKIPQYADYGFAVFQLKQLRGEPHPMAFEFKTRLRDELFFPTIHIHDGEVHKREHFDHTLYLQNPEFDKVVGRYKNEAAKDRRTGFVRSRGVARNYCKTSKTSGIVESDLLLHRIEMRGKYANKDVIAPLAVSGGTTSGVRLSHMLPIAPAVAAAGGLGWLINRRNTIRKNSHS